SSYRLMIPPPSIAGVGTSLSFGVNCPSLDEDGAAYMNDQKSTETDSDSDGAADTKPLHNQNLPITEQQIKDLQQLKMFLFGLTAFLTLLALLTGYQGHPSFLVMAGFGLLTGWAALQTHLKLQRIT